MIWVTSRQHQREASIALGLVAITALLLVFEWFQIVAATNRLGLNSCQGAALASSNCNNALSSFMQDFFGLSVVVRYFLTSLPALLGVFIAAPLVSREVEEGTHMFVWTQSITRIRWLSTKVILLGLATLALAGLLSILVLWWHQPFDRMYAAGRWTFFDVMGLAPIAYALFALALGVCAGAVIQRTVPAMAATLVVFVAVRVAVYLWRPWFLPPMTLQLPTPASTLEGVWQVGTASYGEVNQTIIYQPPERFWTFQGLEAGIFLLLSLALILASFLWLRYRVH